MITAITAFTTSFAATLVAFASLATASKNEPLEDLINQSVKLKIIEVNKNRKRAVASIRAVLNEEKKTINDVEITPKHIAELSDALETGKITSKQGKEVFAVMMETNKKPSEIIKEKGYEVVSDLGEIDKIVQEVIAANPKAIEDFKSGKTNVVGWLMGQVMKQSHGKANPKEATVILNNYLSKM